MREQSIIFSGEMVRAILNGRKTQTRRVIAWSNSYVDGQISKWWREHWNGLDFERAWIDPGPSPAGNVGPYLHVPFKGWPTEETVHRIYPRYQIGDRLWVKETWQEEIFTVDNTCKTDCIFRYKADGESQVKRWRPSIFMPRRVSRITLEVKAMRGERLQDISDTDAWVEGISEDLFYEAEHYQAGGSQLRGGSPERCAFAQLWDSINEKRGRSWNMNHWVWVSNFCRI